MLKQEAPQPLAKSLGRGRAKKKLESYTLGESIPERTIDLVPGLAALGNETLHYGLKGIGKSTIAEWLIASISAGTARPGEPPGTTHKPGQVIYLIAEDNRTGTVSPRLRYMKADLRYVHIIEGAKVGDEDAGFDFANDIELVRAKIKEAEAAHPGVPVLMVVVSPITAYYGVKDSNDGAQVRTALKPMTRLLKEYNICGWYIGHPRKAATDGQNGSAMDMHLGSIQLINAVRYVIFGVECPDVLEDGSPSDARLILRLVSNIEGSTPYGFKYTIKEVFYEGPVATRVRRPDGVVDTKTETATLKTTTINWEGRYDQKPDDVLAIWAERKKKDKEDKSGATAMSMIVEVVRLGGSCSGEHMDRVLKDAGVADYSRRKAVKLAANALEYVQGRWRLKLGKGDEPPLPPEPSTDTDAEP